MGSTESNGKTLKTKHGNSERVALRDCILDMWMAHIEQIVPVAFGGTQRLVWVTSGEMFKPVNMVSQEG